MTRSFLVRLLFGSALAGAATVASAQNFAPVARISVSSPLPAQPGQAVQLVGSASSDPDAGPSALSFSWDFGDGQRSSLPDPSHPYASRGLYIVALTVSDGADTSVATVEVPVLEPPGPPSVSSSPLALDAAGKLWIANTDSGTVAVMDTATLIVEDELAVGPEPVSLALTRDVTEMLLELVSS